MDGTFVFVVCGAQEHIDTLHFSLRYIQKYSKNKILVLTDSTRNEIPVIHTDIVDVRTPIELDNHQASIYLKTGIHRHLPEGEQYCYLDTDILAISEDVDNIFHEFLPPIRFAPDHCKVNKFSPYAVNCKCMTDKTDARKVLQRALDAYAVTGTPALKKKAQLQKHFDKLKSDLPLKGYTALRYALSRKKFRLNKEFWFDKKARVWYDNTDMPVIFEADTKRIEKETGLRYNRWKRTWVDADGADVWLDDCDHLIERIKDKFGITVGDRKWQHWNGGVFLFNDQSHAFLDAWFEKTMDIFKDPNWKTRDQGTLIATAWEFGLDEHSN
ncbi:MAG: hypothetical protein QF371_10070, partial [Flavobacteriales bacterium]|nr:hypothetical protein [Flavobacteriales bacterium]